VQGSIQTHAAGHTGEIASFVITTLLAAVGSAEAANASRTNRTSCEQGKKQHI